MSRSSLLASCDSDRFVIQAFFPEATDDVILQQFESSKLDWLVFMDNYMTKINQEISADQAHFAAALSKCPLDPISVNTLSLIHERQGKSVIISDANTFFIENILQSSPIMNHSLGPNARTLISEIYTNIASFDEIGKLNIKPYTTTPHNCPLMCRANLCKGSVLGQLRSQYPMAKIIYVGDGANDYCPCSALNSSDVVMVRKGFALEKKIEKNPITAILRTWSSPSELLEHMEATISALIVSSLPN